MSSGQTRIAKCGKMSSKAEDTNLDIEAQHEYDHQERESERAQLERIKSAGVFTISPELFEKVYILFNVLKAVIYSTPNRSGCWRFQATVCQFNPLGFHGVHSPLFDSNAGLSSQQRPSPWC